MDDLKLFIENSVREYDRNESDYEKGFREMSDLIGKNYLEKSDLVRIAKWKLKKFERFKHIERIESQEEGVIESVTKAAFTEPSLAEKIKILKKLDGVGLGVASAILTVVDPSKYAIIDVNVWKALGQPEKVFTSSDYGVYMKHVNDIMKKTGLTAREIDKALFIIGKTGKPNQLVL